MRQGNHLYERRKPQFPFWAYAVIFTIAFYITLSFLKSYILVQYRPIQYLLDNGIKEINLEDSPKTVYREHNSLAIEKVENMKYILLWNENNPFHILRQGQDSFTMNECEYHNCFITYNRNLLRDLSYFDAVIFAGFGLTYTFDEDCPKVRSPHQKYVFSNVEPANMIPVTSPVFDDFFNWTWTYRLSSDVVWRYVTVYDVDGELIGPANNMKWPVFGPVDDRIKKRLANKSKAASWLSSHCRTASRREVFVEQLKEEMEKYDLALDSYGACGDYQCAKSASCLKMLGKNYYFYLSFENSIDEDYVTEKVLTPLNNFMVPVVYGGANYTRFLPPGSYLDAKELGPKKLAKTMNDIIKNVTSYYDFFRWRKHISYKEESELYTKEVCNICTALNNETLVRKKTVYKKFREWWNTRERQTVYDYLLAYFLNNRGMLEKAVKYNYTREGSKELLDLIANLKT